MKEGWILGVEGVEQAHARERLAVERLEKAFESYLVLRPARARSNTTERGTVVGTDQNDPQSGEDEPEWQEGVEP